MSDLVGNPEDQFFQNEAHIISSSAYPGPDDGTCRTRTAAARDSDTSAPWSRASTRSSCRDAGPGACAPVRRRGGPVHPYLGSL